MAAARDSETESGANDSVDAEDRITTPLHLDLFVPYRVSVLANISSRTLAQIYAERFDLTIPEWRVMATLGLEESRQSAMCANTVATRTAMDKVQVSRALSRMLSSNLITRTTDPQDRRRSVLHLSDKGRQVYNQIVPAALQYEESLLEGLSTEEVMQLEHLLSKLTKIARSLEIKDPD